MLSICLKVITVVGLNFFSSQKCKEIAEQCLERPYIPVYDIIHMRIKRWNVHVPDYLLVFSGICNIIKYILMKYPYKSQDIDKNISILTYSLLLRSVTTRLTIVPTCMEKQITETKISYKKIFTSTHDLMFSGHTIVFIFLGRLIEEDYKKNIYFFSISCIIQYLFPISLILSRQHYTIDIVVATIVYNYFTLAVN